MEKSYTTYSYEGLDKLSFRTEEKMNNFERGFEGFRVDLARNSTSLRKIIEKDNRIQNS